MVPFEFSLEPIKKDEIVCPGINILGALSIHHTVPPCFPSCYDHMNDVCHLFHVGHTHQ